MIRFFDFTFSLITLIILSIVFFPIAIILRLTGEGEVFFLQTRVGKDKETFKLFKFVTMLKNSENMDTGSITIKNDPRVLPVGKFLRKSKINELPQLINVFLGDMSFIGPRPLTPETFGFYSERVQKTVSQVKPGLSGIGSVVFRDEEKLLEGSFGNVNFYRDKIAPYKGALEEWYVANTNLRNYFLIIFLTIWVIIKPSSLLIWKIFRDLPEPSEEIKDSINYPSK
tara:strand:- start:109 stop:789 length:681 start_codon:yes stop_codon:yes gene_type:complete